MIGLDTNVLVRFLVRDDPEQGEIVDRVLEEAVAAGTTLYVSDVALCETVWVLRYSYKVPKAEVVEILEQLLQADHLDFSARSGLLRSLSSYKEGGGDFADYLIRERSLEAGCEAIMSFDGGLAGERDVIVLG